MIDGCDVMICYVDPKRYRSGAKNAMNYAKWKDLKIVNLFDENDNFTYSMSKEEAKEYFDKLFEKLNKKWPSIMLSHFFTVFWLYCFFANYKVVNAESSATKGN